MSESHVYKLKVFLPKGIEEKALEKEVAINVMNFTESNKVDKENITSKIDKLKTGSDGSVVMLLVITVIGTVLADIGEHVFREYVIQPIMKKWKTERVNNE